MGEATPEAEGSAEALLTCGAEADVVGDFERATVGLGLGLGLGELLALADAVEVRASVPALLTVGAAEAAALPVAHAEAVALSVAAAAPVDCAEAVRCRDAAALAVSLRVAELLLLAAWGAVPCGVSVPDAVGDGVPPPPLPPAVTVPLAVGAAVAEV